MGLRSATGRAAIGSSCSSSQFAFCVVVSAWPCATCLSRYYLATSPKVLGALITEISFYCLRYARGSVPVYKCMREDRNRVVKGKSMSDSVDRGGRSQYKK